MDKLETEHVKQQARLLLGLILGLVLGLVRVGFGLVWAGWCKMMRRLKRSQRALWACCCMCELLYFTRGELAEVLQQEGEYQGEKSDQTRQTANNVFYGFGPCADGQCLQLFSFLSLRPVLEASVASCQESPRTASSRRVSTECQASRPRTARQVPESLEGRVGFMNSGQEMTKFNEARKSPGTTCPGRFGRWLHFWKHEVVDSWKG